MAAKLLLIFPASTNIALVNTACFFTAAPAIRTFLQLIWRQNDRVAVRPQTTGTWAGLTRRTTNRVVANLFATCCACSLSKGSKLCVVFEKATKVAIVIAQEKICICLEFCCRKATTDARVGITRLIYVCFKRLTFHSRNISHFPFREYLKAFYLPSALMFYNRSGHNSYKWASFFSFVANLPWHL